MKTKGKIVLISCVAALFLFMSLGGMLLYYYLHPAAVKGLIEKSVSRATGASVALKSLSYSLSPLNIAVEGIIFKPGRDLHGFYLEVPELHAEFSLDGPFGHKSLTVKGLEVKGLSCRILKDVAVPETAQKAQPLSFFSAILKRFIAFFVFRDFTFESATLSDGSMTAQLGDQTLRATEIQAHLNVDHRVELSCGVRLEWPSRKMNLLAPLVLMKTDRAISLVDPQIGCSILFEEAVFESAVVDLRHVRGGTDLVYRPDRGKVTFEHMNITLEAADIQEGGQKHRVRLGLEIKADGAFSLKDHQLTVRPLHLTMGQRLQFAGELDAAFGSHKKIKLDIVTCRVTPQELVPLLPSGIRNHLDPLKLAGQIDLSGRIGGVEEEAKWALDADLQARLNQNQISYTTGKVRAGGTLTGSIRARGRVPDLETSATMTVDRAMFSGNGMDVAPFEAAISFSGTHPVFDLKDLSARIPHASARFKNKAFRVDDIRLKVHQGRVNVATQAMSLPEIRFDSSLLRDLKASLEAADGKTRVEIQGKETGLARLALDLGLLPPGWKLAARDSVQVKARFDTEQGMTVTSEWAFQDLGFQDREGSFVGEKVSLTARISGRYERSNGVMAANIAMDAERGEVLYDRFYVDLKMHPLSALIKGKYERHGRHLQLSRLRLGLKDILTCQLNGRILEKGPDWHFDLTADIPKIPLKPLFGLFVVEPFQAEKPLLRTIRVGGTVSADLNLTGTISDWTARGYVGWDDGGVSSEDKGIYLKRIDLSLPFLCRNRDADGPLEVLKGRLSIRSAGLPFIPEQALTFPLEAGPNRLSVMSPTIVKIPGGDVRVGPVVIRGLTGSSSSVATQLTLDRVDMGPLLANVYARPIQGTMSGTLDPIHVERERLTSIGKITAKVFGGEVIFSDPGASGLFTGTPVFKLNARWKDLNLSELTAGTSFGKIEGVLNGYAKDVEIAQGQPQKFDLLLETVRKDKMPQRISVKAVDNISRIGGGQSPFIGVAGMFASVFKEFPYEKIGVHATLENDVFRIHGTIREGGTEYLIKRGLFSGVNVVNQNRGNRVSFKDMIKRIKRVTTSKSGPVIK